MQRTDFRAARPVQRAAHRAERRAAVIMGADIAGYCILMARDEEDTHRRVGEQVERAFRFIQRSRGRVFTFAGDGLMAEFPNAIDALECALRIQTEAAARQDNLPIEDRLLFRIGIHAGEILVEDGRTGGNAVNIANRLQQIAEPGGIALSQTVHEEVLGTVAVAYGYYGAPSLKNVRERIAVHTVSPEECAAWAGLPAPPRRGDAAGVDYRPSLAVLPFRTLTEDQSDAYFAEGIVDDIIRGLGGLKDLVVVARSSTQVFARAPLDLRRIGFELDVRYVLHGSVRRSGNSLRITVELTEAETGVVLWADRSDGEMANLFDLQDRIALRVATSIAPHLRERELIRALRKHPDSMTAFDLTLEAVDHFYRINRDSFARSRVLLERATACDPGYGLAWSRMAHLHMTTIAQGWSNDPLAEAEAAARAAQKAVAADPKDPFALAMAGHVKSWLQKQFGEARELLDRALEVGTSCAWAWSLSGANYGYMQSPKLATEHAQTAVRLAPIGPDAWWHEHMLSMVYYFDKKFEDAVAWGKLSALHSNTNSSGLRVLTAGLVGAGDIKAARAVAAEVMALDSGYTLSAHKARSPFPREIGRLYFEQLRAAGLPD